MNPPTGGTANDETREDMQKEWASAVSFQWGPGTWFVSSRNRVAGPSIVGDRRPYGMQHARRAGEPLTACGEFASEWPLFWDTVFDPANPQSCPRCAERLGTGASGQ